MDDPQPQRVARTIYKSARMVPKVAVIQVSQKTVWAGTLSLEYTVRKLSLFSMNAEYVYDHVTAKLNVVRACRRMIMTTVDRRISRLLLTTIPNSAWIL